MFSFMTLSPSIEKIGCYPDSIGCLWNRIPLFRGVNLSLHSKNMQYSSSVISCHVSIVIKGEYIPLS